jgi:PAS domain S-box-containing protein
VVVVVAVLTRRLSRERRFFQTLLEAVPEAVLAVDEGGRIRIVNRAAEELFGYTPEELVGQAAETLVPERLRAVHARDREAYAASPRQRPMGTGLEFLGRRKDGAEFPADIILSPVPVGRASFVLALVLDLTARKRAEEALRKAHERYRTLVEEVPAVVYAAEFGEAGAWSYVSPQIESLLGFTPEEWTADPNLWARRLHPEDRDRALAEDEHCRRTGEPLRSEYRMLARDGRVVWVRDEATVVRDEAGRPVFYQGLLLDLTERKRAEEDRRRLLHRLVSAQEEERARIAADVHDDPIQKMTAVGIRLATLRHMIDQADQVGLLNQLEETVAGSIGSLRHLLFELRPPALDREGLAAALRQYLLENTSDAAFTFRLEDRLVQEPPAEVRAVAYRVAQEALVNVRKHAQATSVEVLLESRDGGLRVRIRDDGVGFTPTEERDAPPGHLGLPSMRERVELAGGRWRMQGAPGAGTTVEFWLPMGREGAALPPDGDA